jgi:hypothetical protein
MSKGDVSIVKTQLGYHIMYKVANLPGYTPPFNDIKENLKSVLLEDKVLVGYKSLITRLQNEAIIEIYNETVPVKKFKEIRVETNPVVQTIPVEENSVQQEVIKPVESVQSQVNVEVTKEVVSTPESQKMSLANCLTNKNARMFTASWSPDSKTQLDLFENYASSLSIVECDSSKTNAKVEECATVLKKQFPTWPTWQIDGVLYEGVQSLNALAKYSGCAY